MPTRLGLGSGVGVLETADVASREAEASPGLASRVGPSGTAGARAVQPAPALAVQPRGGVRGAVGARGGQQPLRAPAAESSVVFGFPHGGSRGTHTGSSHQVVTCCLVTTASRCMLLCDYSKECLLVKKKHQSTMCSAARSQSPCKSIVSNNQSANLISLGACMVHARGYGMMLRSH